MRLTLLFFLNSALLGAGLAMDAFSVSLANGLAEPRMRRRRMAAIAGVYALFQFLMPMIGWFLVRSAGELFKSAEPFIPWIALLLLCWIGGKMLLEGIRERGARPAEDAETKETGVLTPWTLFVQGVATSIDAVIAAVTFVICLGGVRLGRHFGTKLTGRASILGGCILIAIGIEILVKSLL